MFRSTPGSDRPSPEFQSPEKETLKPSEVIPLVVLELSLAPPVEWAAFLADRGMSIIIDDIGRPSVSRSDARLLLTEQREAEKKRREKAAELERQAVEADQQRRGQIYAGIPAAAILPMCILLAPCWRRAAMLGGRGGCRRCRRRCRARE
jgi:hypothetical protein